MAGMWDDDNGQSASLSDGGLGYPPEFEFVDASATSVTLLSLYSWRGRYAIKAEVAYDRTLNRTTKVSANWMKPVEIPVLSIPGDNTAMEALPEGATLGQIVDAMVATRETLMAAAAMIFDLSNFG